MVQSLHQPYTTEGICLKIYPYQETSFIVHFLTAEQGRISAIAKGVRRPKSPLAGACEPISLSQLYLKPGPNLHILYQYESRQPFWHIRNHLFKMACANVLVELMDHTSVESSEDSWVMFHLLKTVLEQIEALPQETDDITILAWLIYGQMQWLNLSGHQLILDACILTHTPLADDRPYYSFSAELGGVITLPLNDPQEQRTLVPVSTTTLKVLRHPIAALENGVWNLANPVKVLRFLDYLMNHRIERKLKSLSWLQELMAQAPVSQISS